ncbi:hypothetical protein V6N13_044752 [Hibiscus sabdariffa]|uniref:Uncharacterized protein n=1 Tax=Hibiscus sabdariffa TaxID=183260 RepID=A0ABR2RJ49_9ROSI
MQPLSMAAGSSLKPPTPLPSPPKASTWNLLNPFESFESYYPFGAYSKFPVEDEDEKVTTNEPKASFYHARPNVGIENDIVEYEVHVVDKKVVEKKLWRGRRNPSSSMGLGMVKVTQNG